jgi:hypothetical protein
MIKIARMTPTNPRGKIIGKQTGGPRLSEAEQLLQMRSVRRLV